MRNTIFITGGARSGKSAYAEKMAEGFGAPLGYLATAEAEDAEMLDRISRHQYRRGSNWQTVEEPLHLPQTLARLDGQFRCILVDCVTLWLSNLIFIYEDHADEIERRCFGEIHRLAATLNSMTTPVILVTNEVGMGIVPENDLARLFRDIAGQANQILAAVSTEAWLVASGIPLKLK